MARQTSSTARIGNPLAAGSVILLAAAVVSCTSDDPEPTAGATSAASPAEASAVPLDEFADFAPLDPGAYVLGVLDGDDAPMLPVLEVPEGYTKLGDGTVGTEDLERYVWVWEVESVYAHPCDTQAEPVGPSVADLAEALAAQELRSGTEPVPVTIDGHDGLYVELSVPDAVDVSTCSSGRFGLWPGRFQAVQEILGQVDRVWIVDVDGQRLVFDAAHMPITDPARVAELEEMVTTATFASADGG
jgi:hypothetical protein